MAGPPSFDEQLRNICSFDARQKLRRVINAPIRKHQALAVSSKIGNIRANGRQNKSGSNLAIRGRAEIHTRVRPTTRELRDATLAGIHAQKITSQVRLDFEEAEIAVLARVGNIDSQALEDTCGLCAHDQDLLGQEHGLADAVRDKENRFA